MADKDREKSQEPLPDPEAVIKRMLNTPPAKKREDKKEKSGTRRQTTD